MPSARGIRAGAAYVELYANDNRLARGLKRAQKRLAAFGSSVRRAGMQMVKLAAVFATPFIAGAKVFADFEDQLANVSTMLDEPEKHMESFREGLRAMSVEFGESTETLAGGLYDILSASVAPEHALNVLAVAAKAAKAGMTDTKTAADAVTTLLNAYGLSAEHAGSVSDLLFTIVKRGKTTFAELAPSIGMVATTAATAGVSMEEMGAALATMTRNGVRTENAVTALNAIVSTFLKPTDEAAAYARELGFEMSSAAIKSEGLAGVFQQISSLPPDAIAKLFPNIRALRGVLPALANMEGFLDDVDLMANRAGMTEVAYEKMTKTLGHSFRQLKQAGIAVLASIGEALAEPLSKVVKRVKEWALNLADLIAKNKDFIIKAAKIVAIVGAVGSALLAVGSAAAVMSFAIGGIVSVISAIGTAISAVVAIVGAILSPIGLVITAVVALGAYILYATGAAEKALGWLGDQFSELGREAKATWKGIGDALAAGDIGLAARVLWLALKMEWIKGVNFLEKIWLDFKGWFLRKTYALWYGSLAIAEHIWHALRVGWIELTSFFEKAWVGTVGALSKAWYWWSENVVKAFNWVRSQIDWDFDREAANRRIEQHYDRKREAVDAEYTAAEAHRQERRAEATREHQGVLSRLGREALSAERGLEDEYNQRIGENEAELAEARKAWQAAISEATQKSEQKEAAELEGGEAGEPSITTPSIVDRLQAQLAGVGQAVGQATRRALQVDVVGLFSAAAAGRLGVGPTAAEERTAMASEETARNTRDLLDEVRGNELVFE